MDKCTSTFKDLIVTQDACNTEEIKDDICPKKEDFVTLSECRIQFKNDIVTPTECRAQHKDEVCEGLTPYPVDC